MRPARPRSELSSDQLRLELCEILAAGLLRLRKQRLLTGNPILAPRQNSSDSAGPRLDVAVETVLSVHTG